MQHLGRVHPDKEVRILHEPPQQIGVHGHPLGMLLEDPLDLCRREGTRCLVQLPPAVVHLEDRKGAVDPWLGQELFPIHCRKSRLHCEHGHEASRYECVHSVHLHTPLLLTSIQGYHTLISPPLRPPASLSARRRRASAESRRPA